MCYWYKKAAYLPEVAYLNATLFQDIIFGRKKELCERINEIPANSIRIRFRALCSYVQPNQRVYVVGSTDGLGK
jgi:hypothetical protein